MTQNTRGITLVQPQFDVRAPVVCQYILHQITVSPRSTLLLSVQRVDIQFDMLLSKSSAILKRGPNDLDSNGLYESNGEVC